MDEWLEKLDSAFSLLHGNDHDGVCRPQSFIFSQEEGAPLGIYMPAKLTAYLAPLEFVQANGYLIR